MTGLRVSITEVIVDLLKRKGFKYLPWRKGGAKALRVRIFQRNGHTVVVVPSIEMLPSDVSPLQVAIDNFFNRLKNMLEAMMRAGLSACDLFFQGGGNIPIPEWFMKWCEENGIRIHICDVDSNMDRVVNGIEG